MSRCECCNNLLTPQESVRKFKLSGEYTNACGKCLKEIGLATVEGRGYRGYYSYDEDDGSEYLGCTDREEVYELGFIDNPDIDDDNG